jgi:hypothetical protein
MDDFALLQLSRPAVLVAGAGISVRPPAAAPLWTEIAADTIRLLLEVLQVGRDDWDLSKDYGAAAQALSRHPELLFEQIRINVGTDQILARLVELLSRGKPNVCHLAIADLCRRGLIRGIVTTNFDNYLEMALEQLHVPYRTVVPPAMAVPPSPGLLIFKVHGDLRAPTSIVMTLNRSAQPLSRDAASLLRRMMSDSDLLITGYSGHDLDIFPIIQGAARTARLGEWKVWVNDIREPRCHHSDDNVPETLRLRN